MIFLLLAAVCELDCAYVAISSSQDSVILETFAPYETLGKYISDVEYISVESVTSASQDFTSAQSVLQNSGVIDESQSTTVQLIYEDSSETILPTVDDSLPCLSVFPTHEYDAALSISPSFNFVSGSVNDINSCVRDSCKPFSTPRLISVVPFTSSMLIKEFSENVMYSVQDVHSESKTEITWDGKCFVNCISKTELLEVQFALYNENMLSTFRHNLISEVRTARDKEVSHSAKSSVIKRVNENSVDEVLSASENHLVENTNKAKSLNHSVDSKYVTSLICLGIVLGVLIIALFIWKCRRTRASSDNVDLFYTKPRCPTVLKEELLMQTRTSWLQRGHGPVILESDLCVPPSVVIVNASYDRKMDDSLVETTAFKRKEFYNEDVVEQELKEEIFCRSNQISSLLQLIGRPKDEVPQSIFVYGHTGTGKTFVTSKILRKLKYKYVIVDCIHCYLPKLLFGSILDGMAECEEDSPYAGCDNMLEFIYHLRTMFAASSWKDEAFIIVLKNSERLLQMDSNLLPALLRLQELTKENLCVIFMSSIIFEKFYLKTGFCDPILVHFPQYSKDDVLKILSKNHDWPSLDALYQNYLNLFLSVFYRSCRDLNELRHMVNLNFIKHCEPVISGKVEVTKLWQTITPHLKSALTELYLRMVASKELEETPKSLQTQNEAVSTRKLALSFELPYYSKYFLIAGFLASYSPPKLDKALFVKLSEKRRRKKMSVRSKQELLNDMLLGPKPFTADRLLAIFYSIVGEEVNFTVNLSAQISSLVKLKLLVEVDNSLDHHKYKCAVGMEFVKTIAKTVGFDIVKFLFPPK